MRSTIATHTAALLVGALVALLVQAYRAPEPEPTWKLAFSHDESGTATGGSKELLIAAVAAGQPIRVHWAGRRVQHQTEASFLTIFEGEVFAQFPEIEMQAPATDPVRIEFREPGSHWRALVGTTGDFRAFGDGREPNQRQHALTWFVGGG